METTIKKRGKTAGNSNAVYQAKLNARRAEAEERNSHWAALPIAAQLLSLAKRRGNSTRQITRIKSRI